jgi:hypothetical protein
MTVGEVHRYSQKHLEYTAAFAATALTTESFFRLPLNGYRLTLGYTTWTPAHPFR